MRTGLMLPANYSANNCARKYQEVDVAMRVGLVQHARSVPATCRHQIGLLDGLLFFYVCICLSVVLPAAGM